MSTIVHSEHFKMKQILVGRKRIADDNQTTCPADRKRRDECYIIFCFFRCLSIIAGG